MRRFSTPSKSAQYTEYYKILSNDIKHDFLRENTCYSSRITDNDKSVGICVELSWRGRKNDDIKLRIFKTMHDIIEVDIQTLDEAVEIYIFLTRPFMFGPKVISDINKYIE
jgi:hypothetical protein